MWRLYQWTWTGTVLQAVQNILEEVDLGLSIEEIFYDKNFEKSEKEIVTCESIEEL